MKYFAILALLFALTLTSCTNGDIADLLGASKKDKDGKVDDKDTDTDKAPCFEITSPMSYTMPDGSIIMGDRAEIKIQMDAWYKAHPDVKEKATMNFPFTITYWDGTELEINNAEEFARAKKRCEELRKKDKDSDKDKDKGKKDTDGNPCFEITSLLSYTMPDGSIIMGDRTEIKIQMDEWYRTHPDVKERATMNFPFTITYWDGTELEINSAEEFERAKKRCEELRKKDKDSDKDKDDDDDDGDGDNDGDDDDDKKPGDRK
jgi:hypothetical protein